MAADGSTVYHLLAGADGNKDQSYFLCQLSQDQLSKAIFPIGGMVKGDVRRIAEEQGLATAKRKDSQGICFVGKVDLPEFLQQKLSKKEGNVHEIKAEWAKYKAYASLAEDDLESLSKPYGYTVRDGKKVGVHNGAHFYTIGQRKGLGIGGRKESLYVIGTDVDANVIYVGEGDEHPGLFRKCLRILPEDMHWVDPLRRVSIGDSERFSVRIRYRQPLQMATLQMRDDGAYLLFDEAQRSIAAGQFAALYDGDELVASGVIYR